MPRTYKPTGKPRGRPKGVKNKPKTVEDFLSWAASVRHEEPPAPVKAPEPAHLKAYKAKLSPEERSARAKHAAAQRRPEHFKNVGRKKGVPHHTTQRKHSAARERMRVEITRIIKIMQQNGELPEELGIKQAVAALLEIVGGDEKASDRISAAKVFLDFHKTKPTQKAELTVNPLQFLRDIPLDDEDEE